MKIYSVRLVKWGTILVKGENESEANKEALKAANNSAIGDNHFYHQLEWKVDGKTFVVYDLETNEHLNGAGSTLR